MDLSKLSTADLLALQAGDLSKVSTDGLKYLQGTTVKAPDPTEGMSTFDKAAAGAGKAMVDMARGAGQMLGLVSDKDIEEARNLDAPLMNTTAGKVGNIGGTIATALPTMLIPGANTLTGAALTGSALGLLQPVTGNESRLQNAALGAAAGAGGVAAGRALQGAYQGTKALIEPFTQAGREKIAGRVIQRFANDPQTVLNAQGGQTITGAMPTIAESTGDAGMARLTDSLRSVDPQINNMIGQRLADNNAARISSLQSLAGDSQQRAALEAARAAATDPLYAISKAKTLDVTPDLVALLDRPSMQQALARAANIAKEQGRTFGLSKAISGTPGAQLVDDAGNVIANLGGSAGKPAQITGQTLQDLKMGMDALLKDPTSGIAGAEAAGVKGTRQALIDWMEKNIPEFNAARTNFRDASKPINAMDIGQYLSDKASSNLSDLAGNPRLQANRLLGLLRDQPKLIEQATGRKGVGQALSDVMTPDQMNLLNAVAGEADRAAAVASAGNGPGSATAQRMAAQNILRQLVGPTGLPESWAESALANTVVGKPLNLLYGGVAEPKIQQELAAAVLDPNRARTVLNAAKPKAALPNNALTNLLLQTGRIAPSALVLQPR